MKHDRVPHGLSDYRDLHVTVMGLGHFGGGVGVVRFLAGRGARVTVTDLASANELENSLAAISDCSLSALHLEGHRREDFESADLVVVNPAVAPENEFIEIARRAGTVLTTEIEIFLRHVRGRIVGVTGSTGKSTTAAMIHTIFEAAGRNSHLGGNIGVSLLPLVDRIHDEDWTVLELSSFQLEWLARSGVGADIAVVTNFQPNHLDRHGDSAAYRDAKRVILRDQSREDFAVLNADDLELAEWQTSGRRFGFGTVDRGGEGAFGLGETATFRSDGREWREALFEGFRSPGAHMRLDGLAAACAAFAAGVTFDEIREGLRAFSGLPHRLQFVGEVAGRKFYDDSKATTPQAALAALDSFSDPLVLLAGGWDKQVDLDDYARAIARRCKFVALIGPTAKTLAGAIRREREDAALCLCDSFVDAFRCLCDEADVGDVVLLSPGCASYGMFRDYRERGLRFQELVADEAASSVE